MILYAIIVVLIILSLVAYVAFHKGQQQYLDDTNDKKWDY